MKLNWGHYIVITFSVFVVLILTMVYMTFQQNIELVSENYYAEELAYQDVIEKRNRADKLAQNITWKEVPNGVVFTFPVLQEISGIIRFMRPSDKALDQEVFIEMNMENQQLIEAADFSPGKYLVRIDWKAGEQSYFTEGTLFFQNQ